MILISVEVKQDSYEEQLEKLKYEYNAVFRKLEISDPNEIGSSKYIDDLTKWSVSWRVILVLYEDMLKNIGRI